MINNNLKALIEKEINKLKNTINLIASENFPSKAVREALSSVFVSKYSEGNIGKRYYEGNQIVDELESEVINLVKQFMLQNEEVEIAKNWEVNVQVPTGSIANLVVYNAILNPGDIILSMFLPDGGHLSHGWSFNKDQKDDQFIHFSSKNKTTFVSKIYNVVQYKIDPIKHIINYEKLSEIAEQIKPKLVITGGTGYCRDIDYEKISKIAKSVDAFYLADIAHEAGLIGAGVLNSPFRYADFVTFTTHKTLRGPRGAVVMCLKPYIDQVNKSVMPGLLGGPFNHSIAALHQALTEALTDDFKMYAKQVLVNAKILSEQLISKGYELISGGTDKHLMIINLKNKQIDGHTFSRVLAEHGIITNKSTIPNETGTPMKPSGIRLGTPFVTTRGLREKEMVQIAELIDEILKNYHSNNLNPAKFLEKLKEFLEPFQLDI